MKPPKEPESPLFSAAPQTAPEATPVVAERKVRLVHSTPRTEVIVEPDGPGHFVVSLLREYGTTVASVRYSRSMLEQLIEQAQAALEGP